MEKEQGLKLDNKVYHKYQMPDTTIIYHTKHTQKIGRKETDLGCNIQSASMFSIEKKIIYHNKNNNSL